MSMPSFQILDENNKPISINKLDREICELWGVEYDEKYYAKPYPREHFPKGAAGTYKYYSQINWYDHLGWIIADNEIKTWDELINKLSEHFIEFIGEEDEDGNIITIETIYPKQVQLINYWKSKNYKPKSIKN